MKNKLFVEFLASEKFVGDLPVNTVAQHPEALSGGHREPVAPKIVVCPPMEEMSVPMAAPRGGRLMRALGRRLPRRSPDADSLDSSSGSGSDSGTGSGERRAPDHSSCSASDSGSDGSGSGSERQRRHRSTVSLRRVFQSLNLTGRSSSCSAERPSRTKKQPQPKRILRPPVSYTYVRGLSGLPTQRVPRHTVLCASSGLNR